MATKRAFRARIVPVYWQYDLETQRWHPFESDGLPLRPDRIGVSARFYRAIQAIRSDPSP